MWCNFSDSECSKWYTTGTFFLKDVCMCVRYSARFMPKTLTERRRDKERDRRVCFLRILTPPDLPCWFSESNTPPQVPKTLHSLVLSPSLTYSFEAFKHFPTASAQPAKDISGVILSKHPVSDVIVWCRFMQVNKFQLSIIFFLLMLYVFS